MMNMDKLMNRLFRRVDGDGVVWDLMSGGIGIKTNDGVVTLSQEGTGDDITFTPSLNPFDMSVALPAFAQAIPFDTIRVGDLVYGSDKPAGWVTKKNERSLNVIKQDGHTSNYTPVKVPVMGMNGVMVVRSLASAFGSGDAGGAVNGMQSMMPMLFMMREMKAKGPRSGAGGGNTDDMMMMMLMSQMMGGQGQGQNPMAAMMPMMMMTQMMGGANPFGS